MGASDELQPKAPRDKPVVSRGAGALSCWVWDGLKILRRPRASAKEAGCTAEEGEGASKEKGNAMLGDS